MIIFCQFHFYRNKVGTQQDGNGEVKNQNNALETYANNSGIDMSKVEGVKFHTNPKGPKPVDILLQRMFSQEFDITQDDLFTN